MITMPASSINVDEVGDSGGTYFERHEDYERRLRENSHRWFVPRMIPLSLLWQKRWVVCGGVCCALAELVLLAYFLYLMANGELLLVLSHVVKQSAVVAGTGLALILAATMVSFRMPLCVMYFESILILSICVLHGCLTVVAIVMFPAIPNQVQQAWGDAPADARIAIQSRYSCSSASQLCIDIVSERLHHHLVVIVAIQSLIVPLQLLMAFATVRLARSISKQPSFRIL